MEAGGPIGAFRSDDREAEGFRRLRRWLTGCVLAACLLLAGAYGAVLRQGPRLALDDGGAALRTLSLALAEQVESVLRAEAAVLTSIQREIQARGGPAQFDEAAWYDMFAAHLDLFSENPQDRPLHALYFVDVSGMATASSVSNPTRRADASDRPYFRHHRDTPGNDLHISELSRSKITGKWVFFLTQRISGPDGSFQGVLGISLRAERFEDLFARLGLPEDGTIAIHRLDGAPLYRYPFTEDFAGMPPTRLAGLAEAAAAGAGVVRTVSPFDGRERLVGFTVGRRYPVVALATRTVEGVLAGWRRTRDWFTLLTLSAFAAGTVLFLVARRQLLALEHGARQRRLSQAVDQSPNLILSTDCDGVIDYVNPAFCRFTGWSAEEVIGVTPGVLRTKETPAEIVADLWQTIRAGREWRGELLNRRRDGSTYWASVVISPVFDEGGRLSRFIGVQEDISDRKRLEGRMDQLVEELKRSNQELERFAYIASHDLRQPLRMIASYLVLLRRKLADAFDAEAEEFFRFANDGATRLDRMIADLLEFSRVGRRSDAVRGAVPLGEAATEAVHRLKVAVEERKARVAVAPGMPSVTGDREELIRLFQNLVGNALKYCPAERVPEIAVDFAESGAEWLIRVTDNGIGIAPEDREKAFGIFQRLVGRGEYEGTGIGLAICRKIVEHHGGRIWIEVAADGPGSVFLFTLPKGEEPPTRTCG